MFQNRRLSLSWHFHGRLGTVGSGWNLLRPPPLPQPVCIRVRSWPVEILRAKSPTNSNLSVQKNRVILRRPDWPPWVTAVPHVAAAACSRPTLKCCQYTSSLPSTKPVQHQVRINLIMNEKESSRILNDGMLSPVISIRASPSHTNLSLSSTAAAKLTVEFTLRGSRPITIFIYDTLLSPLGSYSLIHRTFSFIDIKTGARYKPPIIDDMRIIDYRDYQLTYTNAHNFITLYPDTPYIVDRGLRPRRDDVLYRPDPSPMQPGHSYRMHLPDSSKKEHLWWAWGRKWQVLRWRWWPFGEVKDIDDFVCSHKGKEDLAETEFVWEGDCVVDITD